MVQQHVNEVFAGALGRVGRWRRDGRPRRERRQLLRLRVQFGRVAEEVVWEKLRALRAGADLATKRLF